MKEFTSTSFGLLIAYLLPGILGLHALAFQFPEIDKLYASFLTSTSNVGLFFYVVLVALIIGLQLSAARWLIYEVIAFKVTKRYSWPHNLFRTLTQQGKLDAYRAAVDELYRYHQFWGGFSVAVLLFVCLSPVPGSIQSWQWYTAVGLTEIIAVVAAWFAYARYFERVTAILN